MQTIPLIVPDSAIWNWVLAPVFIVGLVAMFTFLWSAFHESVYKGEAGSEKPKAKVKTVVAFIVILWALGFLFFSEANK